LAVQVAIFRVTGARIQIIIIIVIIMFEKGG
jgi:hypothetical protein